MTNHTIQAILTYGIVSGAVILMIYRTIAILRQKKGQPGCNSGCPSCEAKNITKELFSGKTGQKVH
jgi:hypothetical protein